MSPPLGVCPRPSTPIARANSVACPLWLSRERIAFQRSIEADGAARLGIGALVWADFNRSDRRPQAAPTRPVPITADPLKALSAPIHQTGPVPRKGVPANA
jgi:hypothetical protein